MKKVCLLIMSMLLILSGYSRAKVAELEQSQWQLTTIQDEEGVVLACGVHNENPTETAPQIDLVCTAGDGVLTVEDKTHGECYSGTYARKESGQKEVIYQVTLEQEQGFAVVSTMQYEDGTAVPTLVLRVDSCSLMFFPYK